MEANHASPVTHSEAAGGQLHVLGEATIDGVARYIRERDVRKILVLVGAGASVAAGIPDFRSPGTGLYANLQKFDLDEPSDAFSIALLRQSPSIFYTIAKEMDLWPGSFKPTAVHHFIKLLSDEGRLLRCCTQNIDGLERAAGVPEDLLVEAHGSFRTASCIDCHHPFDIERNHEEANHGCISLCDECGGIVKPDVVFFGEQLPEGFFHVMTEDTKKAELVIIIGTSLQVRPFAMLPLYVGDSVPRVLINLERVGGRMFSFPSDGERYLGGLRGMTDSESTSSSTESEADGEADSDDDEPAPAADVHDHGQVRSNEESERRQHSDTEAAAPQATPTPADGYESSSSSSSSSDGFVEYQEVTAHLKESGVCRDVFFPGDCQATVKRLATAMGLYDSLSTAQEAHCRSDTQ